MEAREASGSTSYAKRFDRAVVKATKLLTILRRPFIYICIMCLYVLFAKTFSLNISEFY